MKRKILTLILFIATISSVMADEVSFVASAPKSVAVGQRFRLVYEINRANTSDPSIPNIENIEILSMGCGQQTRMATNSSGRMSYESVTTYTFTVVATKEGEYKIPPATITVDGKRITSNPLTIKVMQGTPNSGYQNQGYSNNMSQQTTSYNSNGEDKDIYIVASLDKIKVYNKEAVLLTHKLYTRLDVSSLDSPMPELSNFTMQEIEMPQPRHLDSENVNGRNYKTAIWRQFVLFPQKDGKLEIPPLTYEAIVKMNGRNPWDEYIMSLNGISMEVKRTLQTKKLTLNVEELPAGKPAQFSGGVGKFTISSEINKSEFKTNEEFTLKITVKGSGNLRYINEPVVEFPDEFEVYTPVVSNNYSIKKNGFSGEKVYEYVIVPRSNGTFTIPAAKMSFFNTATGKYETVEADSYTIDVAKGNSAAPVGGTYVAREESKELATDIRHIKRGDASVADSEIFFASRSYLLSYLIPLILFIIFMIIYKKNANENADTALVRNKKASSVAVRRLKTAKKLMKGNDVNGFYDEILKAQWGYISDKLGIPVSQLTKENVQVELEGKNVSEELIKELQILLNECEFARYAPGDPAVNMDKIYTMAIGVISKMENSIKK